MARISGYGLLINIVASITFPVGFSITQTADDADPFDIPALQIADNAMGGNGDLLVWDTAKPPLINIGVVPNGSDDKNLSILFEQNRPGRGKLSVNDVITLTGIYPDQTSITFLKGAIISGMPGNAIASAGRMKSKVYGFVFENYTRTF